jgi:hypothetical protein
MKTLIYAAMNKERNEKNKVLCSNYVKTEDLAAQINCARIWLYKSVIAPSLDRQFLFQTILHRYQSQYPSRSYPQHRRQYHFHLHSTQRQPASSSSWGAVHLTLGLASDRLKSLNKRLSIICPSRQGGIFGL